MNSQQLMALQHVAADELLFHRGTWGGPVGYRWRGPDGAEAGQVPQQEADVLDRLADLGLIRAERRLGTWRAHCERPTHPRQLALSGSAMRNSPSR